VSRQPTPTLFSYSILGFSQFAVGAAAIFARFALEGASPIAVSACRLVIASAVLLLAAVLQHQRSSIASADRWVFVAAGVALALHFAGWIWSLEYTSVAISTLLVATTPVWTALYDSLAYKQHLSPIAWAAFALGGLGLVMIVGFNTTRPPIAGHELLGDVLALAGAIAIGAYFILVRRVRSAYGTRAIVTRTYSWAAVALVIAAAIAHQAPPAFSNTRAWGGILAMALISQLMGHTALNASLRWFSPSAVAFTTLLEPVLAAVLALLIFGERLTGAAVLGGVLVLAAIAAFLREEANRPVPA
jgi:drug/metabolite transporter (DMT)-like permease